MLTLEGLRMRIGLRMTMKHSAHIEALEKRRCVLDLTVVVAE